MPAIPASTFAPRDERERLMGVFAEVVYEQGYALTRLLDVARRAEVPEAEVLRHWSREADCAVETLDTASELVFSHVARAFMSAPGDCPSAAHHALGALLEHLAGMPAMVHLAMLEVPLLGEHARSRLDGYAALFAEFLGPGFAVLDFEPPDPQVVSTMIAGGILGVLRTHCMERRIDQLPAALAAVSYVCISTFFGIDEAIRVLDLAGRDGSR